MEQCACMLEQISYMTMQQQKGSRGGHEQLTQTDKAEHTVYLCTELRLIFTHTFKYYWIESDHVYKSPARWRRHWGRSKVLHAEFWRNSSLFGDIAQTNSFRHSLWQHFLKKLYGFSLLQIEIILFCLALNIALAWRFPFPFHGFQDSIHDSTTVCRQCDFIASFSEEFVMSSSTRSVRCLDCLELLNSCQSEIYYEIITKIKTRNV